MVRILFSSAHLQKPFATRAHSIPAAPAAARRGCGRILIGRAVQLTFDAELEAFRAEFVAFLDEHRPTHLEAAQRPRSSSDLPDWARRWQRLLFDNGWLVPGHSPEFGGRNASILQQYVHQMELSRRRMVPTFNAQGV